MNGILAFESSQQVLPLVWTEDLRFSQCITEVVYKKWWYVGVVEDISTEKQDASVKFMSPPGSPNSFNWPELDDCCLVPIHHILCFIECPVTTTGCRYTIGVFIL